IVAFHGRNTSPDSFPLHPFHANFGSIQSIVCAGLRTMAEAARVRVQPTNPQITAAGSGGPPHADGPLPSGGEGLTKIFGGGAVPAVDDVSLSIRENEFFTLLGPSGCGKTTTLRLIAGFETPESGSILLRGQRLDGLPPFRRPVNTVFQSYAVF